MVICLPKVLYLYENSHNCRTIKLFNFYNYFHQVILSLNWHMIFFFWDNHRKLPCSNFFTVLILSKKWFDVFSYLYWFNELLWMPKWYQKWVSIKFGEIIENIFFRSVPCTASSLLKRKHHSCFGSLVGVLGGLLYLQTCM